MSLLCVIVLFSLLPWQILRAEDDAKAGLTKNANDTNMQDTKVKSCNFAAKLTEVI